MDSFSVSVPKEVLEESRTNTRFPTLIHKDGSACIDAADRLQVEYNELFGTQIDGGTLCVCPQLGQTHLIALTIPECLPERLPALRASATCRYSTMVRIPLEDNLSGLIGQDLFDIATKQEVSTVARLSR